MKTPTGNESQLAAMIAEANKESTRLYNEIQAAKLLDKVAQKAISKKFTAASSRASALRSLAEMGEEFMVKRLQFATDARKRAEGYDDEALKRRTIAAASKSEREYLLWCEHHGKAPTLLIPPAAKPKLPKPAPKPRVSRRGGPRRGAGRPALGKVQMLIRLQKATGALLRQLAKKNGMSPSEWLEANLHKIPHT